MPINHYFGIFLPWARTYMNKNRIRVNFGTSKIPFRLYVRMLFPYLISDFSMDNFTRKSGGNGKIKIVVKNQY